MTEIDVNFPSVKFKNKIPLYVWWEKFEETVLNQQGEKYEKHRQELFGLVNIAYSPELYTSMSLVKSWKLHPEEFYEMDVHTRARMIAHNTLENMIEIREQHLQIMKRKREKLASGKN